MAGVPWGGSEMLWYELALLAKKSGHQVAVSVFKWPDTPSQVIKLVNSGIEVYFRNRFHYDSYLEKIKGKVIEKTFAINQLKAVLKFKPDILIVNQGSFFDLEIPLYCKFLLSLQIPFVNVIHGNTEDDILRKDSVFQIREVCKKSSKLFFVSNRNKEVAERQLCYNLTNAELINNPVGFSDYSSVPFPSHTDINLAIVGRIDAKRKGHAALLAILARNEWKNRQWHLNIFGSGPDKGYVEMLIEYYRLSDKVTIHGHVNDLKVLIWKNNHVILLPSTNEGCPISLVEAMICERPAVVSDVGGNAELITDGKNGFVADAPSPNSFGRAMEKFWENKGSIESMGKMARNAALEKLKTDPVENALKKVLDLI